MTAQVDNQVKFEWVREPHTLERYWNKDKVEIKVTIDRKEPGKINGLELNGIQLNGVQRNDVVDYLQHYSQYPCNEEKGLDQKENYDSFRDKACLLKNVQVQTNAKSKTLFPPILFTVRDYHVSQSMSKCSIVAERVGPSVDLYKSSLESKSILAAQMIMLAAFGVDFRKNIQHAQDTGNKVFFFQGARKFDDRNDRVCLNGDVYIWDPFHETAWEGIRRFEKSMVKRVKTNVGSSISRGASSIYSYLTKRKRTEKVYDKLINKDCADLATSATVGENLATLLKESAFEDSLFGLKKKDLEELQILLNDYVRYS